MSGSDPPRELHGWRLLGYNMGFFGIFLTNLLISVFSFQFYVYTVNMDAVLTSTGISINLVITAVSSIIFGVMTDNKKPSRLGKRRPFLLYGLPVWSLTSVLIWLPPWKCPPNNSIFLPAVIYFWVILSINGISGASMLSAHAAMLPEQSQTHKNRERVASVGTILVIIASILAMLLPLIVQSLLKDPENVEWWTPSGEILLLYMPLIGFGFGIFGIISIILTFLSIDEKFHSKTSNTNLDKVSIVDTFRQMSIPLKDKKYRKFLTVQFSNYTSGKILGILIIPFLTFVLKFRANEFFIYILVSISCKFGWFYICQKLIKKRNFMTTFKLFTAIAIIVSLLEILFLLEFMVFEWKIILFVITIGTLLGMVYAFGFFATPLSAALIYEAASQNDESERDTIISKISGSYTGANSFIVAIGQAFASLLMGFMLIGQNKENPVIITMGIASIGIFYLVSLIYIRKIKLNTLD